MDDLGVFGKVAFWRKSLHLAWITVSLEKCYIDFEG